MSDAPSPASVKKYLGEGMSSAAFLAEWKQLTAQDKQQLSDGIKNGSLTY